jgi:hypothetical protein
MPKKMNLNQMLQAVGFDRDPSWETKRFPVNECWFPLEGSDEDALESDRYYLCGLADTRNLPITTLEIRTLKPYIYFDIEKYETLYGWVDSCGNVYDHQDHAIHNDSVRVVAWRAL